MLDLGCADSIWVGGHRAGPGDPEDDQYYDAYCAPGYHYPVQDIAVTVQDGDAVF
jgi:hypothetical protein